MSENDDTNAKKDLASALYCYCNHASCCSKCGKPLESKDETKAVVEALQTNERPPRSNVAGNGPLLLSNIPESVKNSKGVLVGIDEAGRGPVLGPMVYGAAYWSASSSDNIPKGFNDSKQLSGEVRAKLFKEMLDHQDIGFCMRSLLPSEISRNMLRPKPYNLNQMSHDSAMVMIRKLLDAGVNVKTCYIDTVGNAASYRRVLEREFPGLEFLVESKADAKYAPCSAASVVAKVMRDRFIESWKFSEPLDDISRDFGSGYPSDPKCKEWMGKLQDPIFGYCDLVRFSWAPTRNKLAEDDEAVSVTFKADLDEDEDLIQEQKGMSVFLGGAKKRKRQGYFDRRKLKVVSSLC